jgi:ABC-type uncharacterized transport system substrate-binding protein
MWYALQRLSLGICLIVIASALLLYSDKTNRKRANTRTSKTGAAISKTERKYKVALVQNSSSITLDSGITGMLDGLSEDGFDEGRNLEVRKFNAEGDTGTGNSIAREVTGGEYDLIMTASTPTLQSVATANKDGKTPHVFALVTDPFAVGVGCNRENPLDHPRHLVGVGTMQPVEHSFRTALQCNPGLKTVGVVWNPGEANSEIVVKKAREICPGLGITLVEATAEKSADVGEAARALTSKGVQALWTGADTSVLVGFDQLLAAAKAARIPVFSVVPPQAPKGALFDLGADYLEVGRLAGLLGAKILKGTEPFRIPVENALPEQLIVNQVALSGLAEEWHFPDELMKQAQVVVNANGIRELRPRKLRQPPAQRMFNVGIAYLAPDPATETVMRGLTDGLRELGFIEGKNLQLRKAHANGEVANVPGIIQGFEGQDIDLLVPMSNACVRAAATLVKTEPVVFTYCYDPLGVGAGKSLSNHLPHMTGVGMLPPLDATTSLVKQLLPNVEKVGTVYSASDMGVRKAVETAHDKFTSAGLRLEEATIANANEAPQALQSLLRKDIQALWLSNGSMPRSAVDSLAGAASAAKLPLFTNELEFTERGVLASATPGFYESGHAAATLVARILLGENPKNIPIQNVTSEQVYVSPEVAQQIGIVVPPELHKFTTKQQERHTSAPVSASAQPVTAIAPRPSNAPVTKNWKLNLIEFVKVSDCEECVRGFHEGLEAAGVVEGRDYTISARNAHGDMPTLSTMVDAAVSEGSDMIVTFSTPTFQAAMRGAGQLPVVFSFVADPFAAGGGKTDTDHVANVTGAYTLGAFDEMVALVKELQQDVKKVGTLFVPSEVNNLVHKKLLGEACEKAGIELIAIPATSASEVADAALALTHENIDAVTQVGGNLMATAFTSIAQAAYSARLPLYGFLTQQAMDGCPVVMSRDFHTAGIDAGRMAAEIMRGKSPKDIPFHLTAETRLVLNKTAAAKCGMTLSPELLKKANKVIE